MAANNPEVQNVYSISLEQLDVKYTPPPLVFEEENSGDEFAHETCYYVDNQAEPTPKRRRDDPTVNPLMQQVCVPPGYVEHLLLVHKGIGFNIRDIQIRYGAKTKIKAYNIRDAVLNLGSVALCSWKCNNKEYFLKCPPKYMPSEILSKYGVNPAEYEASYKAVCKTVPVEKLVEAIEFAANYFPVNEHSLVVPFEIDNSETAHANNNAVSRHLPSNVNPSTLSKNTVSRNTNNYSITATATSSSTVNSPRALVIATVDKDKPITSFDSSLDSEKTSDQRQLIPFEKDIQEDSNTDGDQQWRDYGEYCAIDKNGKFLGIARYMVPTSKTNKKIVSSYSIEARLNESGEIVSTFKPK